jgi:hypothetical protein
MQMQARNSAALGYGILILMFLREVVLDRRPLLEIAFGIADSTRCDPSHRSTLLAI